MRKGIRLIMAGRQLRKRSPEVSLFNQNGEKVAVHGLIPNSLGKRSLSNFRCGCSIGCLTVRSLDFTFAPRILHFCHFRPAGEKDVEEIDVRVHAETRGREHVSSCYPNGLRDGC